MLILTRSPGEAIKIDDDVSIVVLGVNDNQVRIGVQAPKDVAVHREEIYQRIQDGQPAPAKRVVERPAPRAASDEFSSQPRTVAVTVRRRRAIPGG